MKSKSKFIIRKTLNYWGVFENKRKSTCIKYFHDKINAEKYCNDLNLIARITKRKL